MAESGTLLAHLVTKRMERVVEDAATDSLAYILNKSNRSDGSKPAAAAFNTLLKSSICKEMKDCIYFSTQKIEKYSRFDLVGYDAGLAKRVIVESKFDAALGRGQGGGYLQQLANGPSVLLFVVPEYRLEYLWIEVCRDVKEYEGQRKLESTKTNGGIKSTKVEDESRYLMMLSWGNLLDIIEAQIGDDSEGIKPDIRQLRGLTELYGPRSVPVFERGRTWG